MVHFCWENRKLFFSMYVEFYLFQFQKKIHPLLFKLICPHLPHSHIKKMAAQSRRVVWAVAAGWHWRRCKGVGCCASVDVSGDGGGGSGGRGGQRRLLCLACVRVEPLTCRLALRACGPGQQVRGSRACFPWLWQRKAVELFGRRRQGGVHGD